jgi:hypothetical protein
VRLPLVGLDRRENQQLTQLVSIVLILPLLLLLGLPGLALPPALKEKSWKRFFVALALTVPAIVLPLVFFFLSALLSPEAKDLCYNGAIDCFHVGKLALTPFVFWATAALYVVDIYRVESRTRTWIVQGLLIGAMISSVCTVFGFVTHWHEITSIWWLLLVPLYTSVWYVVRTTQALRNYPPDTTNLTIAVGSSLPFWAVSVFWTYKTYLSLPDHLQECFVVTAASRGHRNVVGPLLDVTHRGRQRRATHQLATLWAFEALWRRHAPRLHATFRRVYNIIGPIIARRITSPWIADVFFIALKPAEFFARIVVKANTFNGIKIGASLPRLLRIN